MSVTDLRAMSAHSPDMDKKSQGRLLRAWRLYAGELRGSKMSQQEVANAIQDACIKLDIDPGVRGLPRTRESLARWELGNHRQTFEGLSLIADVYGVSAMDLMKPPPATAPDAPTPPTKPAADYDEFQAIDDAFKSLKRKYQRA